MRGAGDRPPSTTAWDAAAAWRSYWLNNSEYFLVDDLDGRDLGVVDAVRVDSAGSPECLTVVAGWFGRRRWSLSVHRVVWIDPVGRRIIVEDGPTPTGGS